MHATTALARALVVLPLCLAVLSPLANAAGHHKHAGTGLGSKIIHTMAAALQTQVEYINRAPGTVARLVLATANA